MGRQSRQRTAIAPPLSGEPVSSAGFSTEIGEDDQEHEIKMLAWAIYVRRITSQTAVAKTDEFIARECFRQAEAFIAEVESRRNSAPADNN